MDEGDNCSGEALVAAVPGAVPASSSGLAGVATSARRVVAATASLGDVASGRGAADSTGKGAAGRATIPRNSAAATAFGAAGAAVSGSGTGGDGLAVFVVAVSG
ncbi:hypothetical protein [Jiella pacifica]|uniref:Uncharacterized protein n=1 Tax=Jiella pacifica TaxID=2696469 RepID=A0A6N9T406_9HYPH|nr:hypothetical protein [Jiella pacifica]NDW06104.1 hypothetical protein [Jiella pacifica]